MSDYPVNLETVIAFAQKCHGAQKWGKFPYIVHLYSVARHFNTPQEKAVAFLHDVLEDKRANLWEIKRLCGAEVARRVELLTRDSQETYAAYIQRLAISGDEVAIRVKIADLEENLHGLRFIDQTKIALTTRYQKAITILQGVIHGESQTT